MSRYRKTVCGQMQFCYFQDKEMKKEKEAVKICIFGCLLFCLKKNAVNATITISMVEIVLITN